MAKPFDSTVQNASLAVLNSGGGGMNDELAGLLAAKLRKELKVDEEKEAQHAQVRRAQLLAIEEERKNTLARQTQCPHMKPNFTSALVGQKDHLGHHHFVCQNCQREYGDGVTPNVPPVPVHLRIPSDRIGGPQ